MEQAIVAHQLTKAYPPAVEALRGLSLSVGAGTIFGLLGPNGAGKSTAVRVLCTLSRPDSGSACVAGIDVLAQPVRVRHAIGVVGQKHGAAPEATGREQLVMQGELYGITGATLRRRVAESLERFDLADAADRRVRTYSGGMQRRLDVAMGVLHRPRVLFLDEPTTGLDPEARVDVWLEIERLAADEHMTILLTTHYMEEADRLASELAIIDRGRIVVQGTPHALKGELHGDSIHVELADAATATAAASAGAIGFADAAAAVAALERIDGIDEARLDGRAVWARARDGAAAIPALLAALDTHGLTASSATLARPSLEEVYLRHAGRAFQAAERAHAGAENADGHPADPGSTPDPDPDTEALA